MPETDTKITRRQRELAWQFLLLDQRRHLRINEYKDSVFVVGEELCITATRLGLRQDTKIGLEEILLTKQMAVGLLTQLENGVLIVEEENEMDKEIVCIHFQLLMLTLFRRVSDFETDALRQMREISEKLLEKIEVIEPRYVWLYKFERKFPKTQVLRMVYNWSQYQNREKGIAGDQMTVKQILSYIEERSLDELLPGITDLIVASMSLRNDLFSKKRKLEETEKPEEQTVEVQPGEVREEQGGEPVKRVKSSDSADTLVGDVTN